MSVSLVPPVLLQGWFLLVQYPAGTVRSFTVVKKMFLVPVPCGCIGNFEKGKKELTEIPNAHVLSCREQNWVLCANLHFSKRERKAEWKKLFVPLGDIYLIGNIYMLYVHTNNVCLEFFFPPGRFENILAWTWFSLHRFNYTTLAALSLTKMCFSV